MGSKVCVPSSNEEEAIPPSSSCPSSSTPPSTRRREEVDDVLSGLDSVPIPTTIQRPMPVNRQTCPLLRYVWERDWPNAMKRVEAEPHEAHYVTKGSGRTALHLACFNQGCPVQVAKKLVQANPHALWIQDSQMFTPLHCVCAFRGNDTRTVTLFVAYFRKLVQVLGENNLPEMLSCPETPLYLACQRNACSQVLRELLELVRDVPSLKFWVAPITGAEQRIPRSIKARSAFRPLQELQVPSSLSDPSSLSESLIESLRLVTPCVKLGVEVEDPIGSNKALTEEQLYWHKVCIVCQGTSLISNNSDDSNRQHDYSILQTIVCMELQTERLLRLACKLVPEQAAVVWPGGDGRDGFMALHHAVCNRKLRSVDPILDIYPQAAAIAMEDYSEHKLDLVVVGEMYPLHFAVWNPRHSEESQLGLLRSLMKAAPHVAKRRDSRTGMYPFQFAAMRRRRIQESSRNSLTCIYVLLREAPELLTGY